jgi:hypothetical protein
MTTQGSSDSSPDPTAADAMAGELVTETFTLWFATTHADTLAALARVRLDQGPDAANLYDHISDAVTAYTQSPHPS